VNYDRRVGIGARGRDRTGASWSVLAALSVGFAAVFGLWLYWGFELVRGLRQIESSVRSASEQSARAEQALSTIRTNVLLGSIYLRDVIIGDPAVQGEAYGEEIAELRNEVDRELGDNVGLDLSEGELQLWNGLRVALDDYWASRELPGGAAPADQRALALSATNSGVPYRDAVLAILDRIGELQQASGERFQNELTMLYERAQARLVSMGVVTLVIALVVALAVSRHAYRLQREIERQREAERQNRRDLQRLSARLVDAQEDERRSIARELHDEIGQALTAVKVDIGVALKGTIDPGGRSALQEAREIADTTLRGVRDLSQLLHPSVLDDFGLPSALDAYVLRFSQRSGIHVQLIEMIDDRLSSPVELCLYRLVQEALTNVAQHSGATTCIVSLTANAHHVRLVVEDNGRGLPAADEGRHGLGLIGMRERAQALGGTLDVGHRRGGGTRVIAELPLPAPETSDRPQPDGRTE
jgi:signal transduction histidine kinase